MAKDPDIPSPALQERMQVYGPTSKTPSMVELSNGKLVTQEELGSPPPEQCTTLEDIELWYENREDELLFGDDNG